MTNFDEKQKSADELSALNEGTFTPIQILREIDPLLKDYFVGDFKTENNALKMNFKNGQKFRIVACEVC